MKPSRSTPIFDGRHALIVHRPHQVVDALTRQLRQIGMSHEQVWPDALHCARADMLFYDADMGHDGQFPWACGAIPMPAIALIGSEAPGRLAWAIGMGADAHLLKPIGSGGVYSALVIAAEAYERRAELNDLRARLGQRQTVAEATACLMLQKDLPAEAAYNLLRREAMDLRTSIEARAEEIVARLRDSHVRNRA